MKERDFKHLVALVPDGLVLIGADGVIRHANSIALRRLELAQSQVLGQPFIQLTPDSGESLSGFLRMCRRSPTETIGSIHVRPGRRPIQVFGRLLALAGDKPVGEVLLRIPSEESGLKRFAVLNEQINKLGREISRRRAVESALRAETDLARFSGEVNRALVEEVDVERMLIRCTNLMVDHLGAAFARIWLLEDDDRILKLRASSGMYTHLDGAHSRVKVGEFKIGMIAKTQQAHRTNSVIGDSQVHDQQWAEREGMVGFVGQPMVVDGRMLGVMAMFAKHEITDQTVRALTSVADSIALGVERKRVDRKLRKNARILRKADKRKDEFLAMLGHELRNPLAPIRHGLELLQLRHGSEDTLTMMQVEVDHMARLVDDLLDISRITRRQITLKRAVVNINDIVKLAVNTIAPAVAEKSHSLTLNQSAEPIWVKGDEVRLTQIVNNLLTNAVRYTPPHGQIDVWTREQHGTVNIVVQDDGEGIDANFLPDIFDLFAQSERGLARSEGGLGVGLTLVRRLVDLHEGSVEVSSKGLGEGSEFVVSLSTIDDFTPPKGSATPQAQPVDEKRRILVVDDNVASSTALAQLLEAMGITDIAVAHDGEDALRQVQQFKPDLVFLDLGLPGLNGLQVAERVRSGLQTSATTLIAVTGYGTPEDRQRSMDAGFDAHLVKPVNLGNILEMLALHH